MSARLCLHSHNHRKQAFRQLVFLAAVIMSAAIVWTNTPASASSFYEMRMSWMPPAPEPPDLTRLSKYDVVVLIDKSSSMKFDCYARQSSPGGETSQRTGKPRMSRWEWCREETTTLARDVVETLPEFRLGMFNDEFEEYDHVTPTQVKDMFVRSKPRGGTYIGKAIKSLFSRYFTRRQVEGESTKPLLIAMITDGCPMDRDSFQKAIIEATHKMNRQNEIKLTILQVGNDPRAPKVLNELDQKLTAREAKYDIVSVKTFDEVQGKGLVRALAEAAGQQNTLATPVLQYYN